MEPSIMLPTFADIQQAATRIKPYAHRTPVFTCTSLNQLVGADPSYGSQLRRIGYGVPAPGQFTVRWDEIGGRYAEDCAVAEVTT